MKTMYDSIYAAHITLTAILDGYKENPDLENMRKSCEFLHNNFIQVAVLYGRKRLEFALYDCVGLATALDKCIAPPETHVEVTFHTTNGLATVPLYMLSELIARHTESSSQESYPPHDSWLGGMEEGRWARPFADVVG
jgi:hypothetical protein